MLVGYNSFVFQKFIWKPCHCDLKGKPSITFCLPTVIKIICLLDKFCHWMNYFVVVFKHKIRSCWYNFQLRFFLRYRCFLIYNGGFLCSPYCGYLIDWFSIVLHPNLKLFIQIISVKSCTNQTFAVCVYHHWAKRYQCYAISAWTRGFGFSGFILRSSQFIRPVH